MARKYYKPIPQLTPQEISKFHSLVNSGNITDCWPWSRQYPSKKYKYGYFQLKSHTGKWGLFRTHRIAYFLAYGPFDWQLEILHRCDNPPCCNPSHLFIGTNMDNIADRIAKDRTSRGLRHSLTMPVEKLIRGSDYPHAKLTEIDIPVIRQMFADGIQGTVIAKQFNISSTVAYRIRDRKDWGHVL